MRVALGRYGADVYADHGPVWDRVDVEPALYRADIERRGAEYIVARHIEVELLQRGDGSRRFVNGVDALLRHGAVSGYAFHFRLQPEGPLVTDQRLIAGGFRHDQSPDLAELDISADQRLGTGAAGFLSGSDHKQDAGRIGEPTGERNASGDESRHAALHVR